MTRYIRHTFTGLLSLSLSVGMFTSCSDVDGNIVIPGENQGESLFSLDFVLEQDKATRADGDYDGAVTGVISKGLETDMLVFAIYDSDGNLLTDFSKSDYSSITIGGKIVTAGAGQNIIPCADNKAKAQLAGMTQGATYTIVAWAQSSKCDAYDFSNLENVKVSYKDAQGNNYVNNDETRDAFCASVEFTVPEESTGSLTVELRRPFAQINVGTTGADYRNSAITPGGTYYTYSSIEISGVANSINVLTNVIGNETETVTYGYAKVPAFYSIDIPTDVAGLIQSAGEEFLKIHLNDPDDLSTDDFAGYLNTYPTIQKDKDGNIEKYLTETFKYMSMCYVLVPATGENSTTLDNVKVSFSNTPAGGNYETYFEVTNIPANRNWRTNILGGLHASDSSTVTPDPEDPENPDNPNNPEDPDNPDNPGGDTPQPEEPEEDDTSIFRNISCKVLVVTDYNNGDNNLLKDAASSNGYTQTK